MERRTTITDGEAGVFLLFLINDCRIGGFHEIDGPSLVYGFMHGRLMRHTAFFPMTNFSMNLLLHHD